MTAGTRSRPTGERAVGALVRGPERIAHAGILTDLYELVMAASYRREGLCGRGVFSLFVRRLPRDRGYLVAAGLADVLSFLEQFRISPEAIAYLGTLGRFDPEDLAFFEGMRFRGDVRAVPEGTLVFADEPLLEVEAGLPQAQLVEAAVLNLTHYATLAATKAARCVDAARGRPIVEFGLRRAQGLATALDAARSAWIGGVAATSNVLAGMTFGMPIAGTVAHSYVTAFPTELESFRAFGRMAGGTGHCVLLLDTYDTATAARKAVRVASELAREGGRLAGVRLDSGDLAAEARLVREILDDAGLEDVRIIASGGLDEYAIDRLVDQGAPIDSFGVGTRMDVSADAPYLDMAYKLVRYEGRDTMKLSGGKVTWPGAKQVWRDSRDGRWQQDSLGLREEPGPPGAEPLLAPVMREGKRLSEPEPLEAIRARAAERTGRLDPATLRRRNPSRYPVEPSERLQALRERVTGSLRAQEVSAGPRGAGAR